MNRSSKPRRCLRSILKGCLLFCVLAVLIGIVWTVRTFNEVKHLQFSDSTLHAIAQGLLLHEQEHGHLPAPENWVGELVAAGRLDPALATPTRTDADSIGWVLVDSARFPPGSRFILVYEDPDHHRLGVPVLWNDFRRVETDSPTHADFEAAMAAQGSEVIRDDQDP